MKLNNRQSNLIQLLTKSNDFITVKELADELNVSVRTIHNDINTIVTNESSIRIIKKSGVGVKLEQKKFVEVSSDQFNDSKERAIEIYKRLLFEEENITIQSLSDEFYVSVSSIVNDLSFIKNEFICIGSSDLVSDHRGTRLEGNENQIQRSMLYFNEKMTKWCQIEGKLTSVAKCLEPYYGPMVVSACLEVVSDLENYNLYSVAHHYQISIFSALIVTCYRLAKNKHPNIIQSALIIDEIMAMRNYLIAKDLLEMLSNKLNFNYLESDIYVLSMYLQAYRLEFHPSRGYVDENLLEIAKRMIRNMSNLSNVSLNDDRELLQNLVVHLYHMIYRRRNSIEINNPLLDQIKKEFRVMYDLTFIAFDAEKSKMNVDISEHEVGFIMLHFQTALDKKMHSKRLLVVCPYGLVSSEFIVNRIRRILPPLDIIESTSITNVERFDIENIDMIVSTIPLPNIKKSVVVISQLATEKDLQNVLNRYRENFINPQETDLLTLSTSSEYMESNLIFFDQEAVSQEEVINRVADVLIQKDYVLPQYRESLFEREKNGGTEIIAGAALPHGSFELVKRTSLPIWINKTPIKWGSTYASVIIFFSIAKSDLPKAKKILEELFKLLRKKENIKIIMSKSTKQALLDLLGVS